MLIDLPGGGSERNDSCDEDGFIPCWMCRMWCNDFTSRFAIWERFAIPKALEHIFWILHTVQAL